MKNCMKIKKLKWEDCGDRVSMTSNDIPQMLYVIRRCVLSELPLEFGWSLQFFHGYDNGNTVPIFKDSAIDECKWYAQNHFENYIKASFLEND